jgi:HK97 family phage major capsid protein
MDKNAIRKAVNSYLHRGWAGMDDADRALLKPINATDTPGQVETVANRGGVLVPVEVADFVARMDTGVYRLRTRVTPYEANTLSGKIPLAENPTSGLVQLFDELPAGGISKGQITFGSVNWQVKDYGLIVPVSNDLLADANADVMSVIAEQFNRAQVITENGMILAAIDANGAATAVTGWEDILKEINATDPVGGTDKVIVTNTDGYNYFDTLVDDEGRPILTQALVDNPRRIFRGYEVIQLPNASLATDSTTGAIPFYVGSLFDAVVFIERKGMEISFNPYADSAFQKNATDVRVACRMDCKSKFTTAVKKLTYTPA